MTQLLNRPAGLAVLLAVALAGCKDTGFNPNPSENLRVSLKAPASVLGKTSHIDLHLTSVKVLLKEITFAETGSDDSVEIETGPQVIALNLEANVTEITAVKIRPGVYNRIRLTVHKPEDNEIVGDSVFTLGESGNSRFSAVITGFYHDAPFTFRSRETTRMELPLGAPVTVSDEGTVNITILIDPYLWFHTNGLLLDPFNQQQEIDNQIKSSFAQVFRDLDRNGEPD